ncbi:exodeoxyribonuclease V subunit beta [Chlorobium sp. N1]|nr:exodeoxyribonuclease V subunit beta [Chlorobium sp. N1]
MRPLDHASVPLGGMNLIEASAGTGKTHAIASLYLRLLVEGDLLAESILVVTYTEAASGELRGRIRGRIRDTLEALRAPGSPAEVLAAIGAGASEVGADEASRRLERALAAFDTAAVHTIHAFCLRALQEHAFESGSLYDTELGTDQQQLLRAIVDDFWRLRFFPPEAPLSGYLGWRKDLTPESFVSLLSALRPGPLACIRPAFSPGDDAAAEARVKECFSRLCTLWREDRTTVLSILADDPGLSRAAGAYKKEELPALFELMDGYLQAADPYACFRGFGRFGAASLRNGTKKKFETPLHPFFEAVDGMLQALEARLLVLKAELVEYYRAMLPKQKEEQNVRFFDDLLNDLYRALGEEEGGGRLGEVLRRSYPAALIDEFQDTDPVQYEIFRRIYAGSGLPLFLIGDPKQAIYSFRGADLFAYLGAAASVGEERRFTLEKNWRSAPLLLEGFNMLFRNDRNPFLYPDIAYRPLTSGGGGPKDAFTDGKEALDEPLQVWLLDSRDTKKGSLTVEAAEESAAAAVAREIVRLLDGARLGRTRIGKRPLAASDIAVIVRTHQQGNRVQAALQARAVPSVMRSDRSVMQTAIAGEVLLLLEALASPASEGRIRSALVTAILGRTGNMIAAMAVDGPEWIGVLRDFAEWHRLWQAKGFMTMIRELMLKEGVRRRVLAGEGGERTLTDLLHCFELLHAREHMAGSGPEGLVAWFSEQLLDASVGEDAFQIRLETDLSAVRIVTVHVSKGLQYPVVFCPFHWKGSPSAGEVASFHDASGEAVRDFGSPGFSEGLLRAGEEELAEDLRLFYVALTRAEHRCFFVAAKIAAGVSAVNYLLHASEVSKGGAEGVPSRLGQAVAASSPEAMERQLRSLVDSSGGAIGFRLVDPDGIDAARLLSGGEERRSAPALRRFGGRIDRQWRVSSFSSLSRQANAPAELPDRDEAAASVSEGAPLSDVVAEGIFAFPKGTRAGHFMHDIFEHLDFSAPDPETIREQTASMLLRYGFDAEWTAPVARMVEAVLQAPLGEAARPFRLGGLKAGSWATELEFFMPMGAVSRERLAGPLRRHGVAAEGVEYGRLAAQLEFTPARGMLMGFMDMVLEADGRFWLIDWKSNHLGNTAADYGRSRMEAAMEEHRYHLQYLLYLAALNRHLARRVPGYAYATHFGGVVYVFLRGVGGEEGSGIYQVRPSEALIEELSAAIAGKEHP